MGCREVREADHRNHLSHSRRRRRHSHRSRFALLTTLASVFLPPFSPLSQRHKRSTKVEPPMFVLMTLSAFFFEVLGLRDQGVARCFESGSFGSSVTRGRGIHFLPFPLPPPPSPALTWVGVGLLEGREAGRARAAVVVVVECRVVQAPSCPGLASLSPSPSVGAGNYNTVLVCLARLVVPTQLPLHGAAA